jgi:hypothetical protein
MKSRMGCVEHVALLREGKGAYRVFMGKPEGKRTLGRPKRRQENNIKIYFQNFFLPLAYASTPFRRRLPLF